MCITCDQKGKVETLVLSVVESGFRFGHCDAISTLPSNMRMPHVFVIPPEEEQQDNPPWCCFDADQQPGNDGGDSPSNPDIHFLDAPSVRQQRQRPLLSRKLEKRQRPEALTIIESKSPQGRKRDSDVIEVIKVKRVREALPDLEENAKVKRSRTLKARATKALQSIKNVSKASHRTHVKDLWTSTETTPGIFKGVQEQIRSQHDQEEYHPRPPTPPKKGSLSRANSRSLSQIFVRPSRSSSTVCVTSSVTRVEAHPILPPTNPSSFPGLGYNHANSSLSEVPITLTSDDALNRLRPRFPSTKRNASKKFSVRELHRLFTFSSPSPDVSSPSATAALPFESENNGFMPSTPTMLSDHPDPPMTEGVYADARFLDLKRADRRRASQHHQAFRAHHDVGFPTPCHLGDLSFETRLDSLHFDSLSFDPEDFDVSMRGNASR